MNVLSPREATVFASVVDAAVRPSGDLPPVGQTDAVTAFDAMLRASPRTNRAALRALLHLVDVWPWLRGERVRLHRLQADARLRWLERTDGALVELLLRIAAHCYYGDEAVMRRLGYDATVRRRRRA